MVFMAADHSLEEGRRQVSRIVGRDTSGLTDQEVRLAALETLAENLSDGVIAPLFWYLLLGVPGMLAYKMINTLDSMVGYKNERYLQFGRWAARIDDIANYIPARLTAVLMILSTGRLCFGGPHHYFGEMVYKPFIGNNNRPVYSSDMRIAVRVNRFAEGIMVIWVILCLMEAYPFLPL